LSGTDAPAPDAIWASDAPRNKVVAPIAQPIDIKSLRVSILIPSFPAQGSA